MDENRYIASRNDINGARKISEMKDKMIKARKGVIEIHERGLLTATLHVSVPRGLKKKKVAREIADFLNSRNHGDSAEEPEQPAVSSEQADFACRRMKRKVRKQNARIRKLESMLARNEEMIDRVGVICESVVALRQHMQIFESRISGIRDALSNRSILPGPRSAVTCRCR